MGTAAGSAAALLQQVLFNVVGADQGGREGEHRTEDPGPGQEVEERALSAALPCRRSDDHAVDQASPSCWSSFTRS